jgi:hypothetical protein
MTNSHKTLQYPHISVLYSMRAYALTVLALLLTPAAVVLASVSGAETAQVPDIGVASGAVPLTKLSLDSGAACLDGTPYGFYYVPSKTGSTQWTISIQGGGWCYNETLCEARAKTRLGSSNFFPSTASCGCMSVEHGTINKDCNCIYMPYCDGASFSGFREDPWPVPSSPGSTLHFRGMNNLDATLDFAFEKLGLDQATKVVLTGGSAGGLSTFLHSDHVAERVWKEANRATLKSAPVVGYFLDHANYENNDNSYPNWMKYIYYMQNLTVPALMQTCLDDFPVTPYYCFMSPHMEKYIATPFFMFNSKYDAWQMTNILQVPCLAHPAHHKAPCDADEQAAVIKYGQAFMDDFQPVTKQAKNGAMITSCICHGCNWNSITLDNKNSYEHYAEWYEGTAPVSNFHIDPDLPNGGGKMNITANKCEQYP